MLGILKLNKKQNKNKKKRVHFAANTKFEDGGGPPNYNDDYLNEVRLINEMSRVSINLKCEGVMMVVVETSV